MVSLGVLGLLASALTPESVRDAIQRLSEKLTQELTEFLDEPQEALGSERIQQLSIITEMGLATNAREALLQFAKKAKDHLVPVGTPQKLYEEEYFKLANDALSRLNQLYWDIHATLGRLKRLQVMSTMADTHDDAAMETIDELMGVFEGKFKANFDKYREYADNPWNEQMSKTPLDAKMCEEYELCKKIYENAQEQYEIIKDDIYRDERPEPFMFAQLMLGETFQAMIKSMVQAIHRQATLIYHLHTLNYLEGEEGNKGSTEALTITIANEVKRCVEKVAKMQADSAIILKVYFETKLESEMSSGRHLPTYELAISQSLFLEGLMEWLYQGLLVAQQWVDNEDFLDPAIEATLQEYNTILEGILSRQAEFSFMLSASKFFENEAPRLTVFRHKRGALKGKTLETSPMLFESIRQALQNTLLLEDQSKLGEKIVGLIATDQEKFDFEYNLLNLLDKVNLEPLFMGYKDAQETLEILSTITGIDQAFWMSIKALVEERRTLLGNLIESVLSQLKAVYCTDQDYLVSQMKLTHYQASLERYSGRLETLSFGPLGIILISYQVEDSIYKLNQLSQKSYGILIDLKRGMKIDEDDRIDLFKKWKLQTFGLQLISHLRHYQVSLSYDSAEALVLAFGEALAILTEIDNIFQDSSDPDKHLQYAVSLYIKTIKDQLDYYRTTVFLQANGQIPLLENEAEEDEDQDKDNDDNVGFINADFIS